MDQLLAAHGIGTSDQLPLDSGDPAKPQPDAAQMRSPSKVAKHVWPKWIHERRRESNSVSSPSESTDASAPAEQAGTLEHLERMEAALLERDRWHDQIEREDRWKSRPRPAADTAFIAELEALLLQSYQVDTDSSDDVLALGARNGGSTSLLQAATKPAEHSKLPPAQCDPGASKRETVKGIEELVTACERSWHPDRDERATAAQPAPVDTFGSATSTSGAGEACKISDVAVPELIEEITASSQHMRWTWQAFYAYRNLRMIRPLARNLSRRVFGVDWEPRSGDPKAKNFPFLIKSSSFSSKRISKAFNEEWEVPHQVHPERRIPAGEPTMPDMPAWNKLPATRDRPLALRELVVGVRFASIAFQGPLSPQDWAHTIPGSDVLCMSIDLNEEAAHRFLAGDGGDVGKSLKRRLLRRLDHRGNDGEMTAAAIWTRPTGSSSCTVRVFILFQEDSAGAAFDVEREDRNRRFWHALQKHNVEVSPDGMPLKVLREHLAPYLGLSAEELDSRWDADVDAPEIQEYTPTDGFSSPEELARRREQSHRKWIQFTSRLGMPPWINTEFMKRVQDYFFFPQEHVRARDRLLALRKKYRYAPYKFTKAKQQALTLAQLRELSPGDICVFKCSPAQFAALAVRGGEVLGEYCDSAHKAGRAKELYETISKEWKAAP
ncbi:MAG: hypothetical protein ABI216_04070 [Devosia sp.]